MKPRVLLVDDDMMFVDDVLHHLGNRFEWITRTSCDGLVDVIRNNLPDVTLLDIEFEGNLDGLEMLSKIRQAIPSMPVIMVTRHAPADMAADAWRRGAFGYIEKGSSIDLLAAQIERAVEEATVYREKEVLRSEVLAKSDRLIGKGPAMAALREEIARVAPTSSTVLITGETGSGKTLVARLIHEQSPRRDHLFVHVSCPELTETLFESELFGHERGAFTGAVTRKIGKLELAHRGTIFLDEIAELKPPMQAKLLRVLEDSSIRRVGGTDGIQLDLRIIAATNRNIKRMVADGLFRDDLYFRLRVVQIHIPPLRARKADIPDLVEYVLALKTREMKRPRARLSASALNRFLAYSWDGNVRELENVLENALVHWNGDVLDEYLFERLIGPEISRLSYRQARRKWLEEFERSYIGLMLKQSNWNMSEAARRMEISREGLRKLMKRYGIERGAEKSGSAS